MERLICIGELTKMMKETMVKCGMYKQGLDSFSKIQILTIKEVISGKYFNTPSS